MTRISVITICWNDVDGLRRTLASVAEQTWPDVEHVVVDGGSTDGTRQLLEEVGGSLTWVSERDGGRYDAMNKGVALSHGELVWFMHAGDTFASATTVATVAADAEGRAWRWGYGLSRVRDGRDVRAVKGDVPFNPARFFLGGRIIPHQAAVFERTLHQEMGGYDTSFGLTADQLYMMRATLAGHPQVWPEFFCDFDASGAGSTRGAFAHFRDVIRARSTIRATVTGRTSIDALLSLGLAAGTSTERVLRRLSTRLTPRVTDAAAGSAGRSLT